MTHWGGCKNQFEQLELWSEAALLTKLRDISPTGKQVIKATK